MKLIHYGANKYNPDYVLPIRNRKNIKCKPSGGLWTSPTNSKWGWKDWNNESEFRKCIKDNSFELELKSDTRLLTINSIKDLELLPLVNDLFIKSKKHLDYVKLSKNYDAIHLTINGEIRTKYSKPISLYGWDCETVLILNNKCIK